MHKTYSMAINFKLKKKSYQCAKCYIFLDFSICVLVFNVKKDLWFFVIKKKEDYNSHFLSQKFIKAVQGKKIVVREDCTSVVFLVFPFAILQFLKDGVSCQTVHALLTW